MTIQNWLDTFFAAWIEHDIDTVLSLFTDTVEYWETPFLRIASIYDLRDEWQYILTQSDITIWHTLFAIQDNKYTVHWHLEYMAPSSQKKEFSWIYLIELDEAWKCFYFFQCWEQKL